MCIDHENLKIDYWMQYYDIVTINHPNYLTWPKQQTAILQGPCRVNVGEKRIVSNPNWQTAANMKIVNYVGICQ